MEQSKAVRVKAMFADIAGRYDFLNRLMSLGMDRRWRDRTIRQARPRSGGLGLDVGAGTGDLTLSLARRMAGGTVVALDFCEPMLRLAMAKARESRLSSQIVFHVGDAMTLPYRENVFDSVVTAFTLRNVVDIRVMLSEMVRVAAPGGRVVCLEITRPRVPVFSGLFRAYFGRLVPVMGGLLSGHPEAYSYLPISVDNLPPPHKIARMLAEVGLEEADWELMGLGTVALYAGTKKRIAL